MRNHRHANHPTNAAQQAEEQWRCCGCGKLLGRRRGSSLHVRFERAHEYLVSLPASATCRRCGSLNGIDG